MVAIHYVLKGNVSREFTEESLKEFLKKFVRIVKVHPVIGPTVETIPDGCVGVLVFLQGHVVVRSHSGQVMVMGAFLQNGDLLRVKVLFRTIFSVEPDELEESTLVGDQAECEEPNCFRDADELWKGRALCKGCYNKWTEDDHQFSNSD